MSNRQTPAMKRKAVAIANDARLQINRRKYIPTEGTYLDFDSEKYSTNHWNADFAKPSEAEVDLQPVLNNKFQVCEVCAIGAFFASKVRVFDSCKIPALRGFNNDNDRLYFNINSDQMRQHLKTAFTDQQIIDMENLFEGGEICGVTKYTTTFDENNYTSFYNRHKTEKSKMNWIVNSIIKNNGVFKLPPKDTIKQ